MGYNQDVSLTQTQKQLSRESRMKKKNYIFMKPAVKNIKDSLQKYLTGHRDKPIGPKLNCVFSKYPKWKKITVQTTQVMQPILKT